MIDNAEVMSVVFKICILLALSFVIKLKPKISENFEQIEDLIIDFDINKKISSDQYKQAKKAISEIKSSGLMEDKIITIYKEQLEEICLLIDKNCYLQDFKMETPKDIIEKIQVYHPNFLK